MSTTDLLKTWQISEQAINFIDNLRQEQAPGTHLYIEVEQGGTPQALMQVRFEPVKSHSLDLCEQPLTPSLSVFCPKASLPFLKELTVDFKNDLLSGQLEIQAPHLYGEPSTQEASLLEQIQIFFNNELLPYLKQHKGHAILQEVTPDHYLLLRFEGGCQGCSMAKVTLKQGIEAKIKERFPQIQGIIDMTDHTQGNQPYA